MRVLVCGGRNWKDKELTDFVLNAFHVKVGIQVLIEGEARGADIMARNWAVDNEVEVAKFPADWNKHGKAAGPIRNKQMLIEGKPDFVIAFPGGTGTANMIKQAKDMGVPVFKVKEYKENNGRNKHKH